jgi:hypothetical protein
MDEHGDDLEIIGPTVRTEDEAVRVANAIATGLDRIATAIERGLGEIAEALATGRDRRVRR